MNNTLLLPQLSSASTIGTLALLLALGFTLFGLVTSFLGGRRGDPRLAEVGRRSSWAVFAFMTLALVTLERSLLSDDFSVRYVAEHSQTFSPLWVKIVTLWAALEGSILLWAWILSLYTFLMSIFSRNDALRPWAMVAQNLSLLFFVGVNLTIANPFTAVPVVPLEGAGPNELLQNHWMMSVHPVLLYLGFVGLSVPFAYAFAAMVTGRVGETWIVQTRRWTLVTWIFLSAAIVAGGYWSYEVLGWGGYWAWDPVENASIIPWLFATAFLHSVQIQERKRAFASWNLWLIVLAYSSTVFGTFLTRSGIVQSVHAFGNGPIGFAFFGFFALLLLVGVGLASWRSSLIRDRSEGEGMFSREGGYLAGNVMWVVFAVLIVAGTLFPVLLEAIRGFKTSVGAPFFNVFAIPLGLALLFFMGLGPMLTWRRMSGESLWKSARWPALLGLLTSSVAYILGIHGVGLLLTFGLSAFVVFGLLSVTLKASLERNRKNPLSAMFQLFTLFPRRYGAYLAHTGLVVLVLGVAVSSAYKRDTTLNIQIGQAKLVFGKLINFYGMDRQEFTDKFQDTARIQYGDAILEPKLNRYKNAARPVPMPAVRYHPLGDDYITLNDFDTSKGQWVTVQVIDSPLVSWIWFGTLIMILGSGITLISPSVRTARVVKGAAQAAD